MEGVSAWVERLGITQYSLTSLIQTTLTPCSQSKLSIARPNGQDVTAAEEEAEESLKLGLLAYPVLQAADVMLYK
jgi:tryptophanyl-tRNA synthetase